MNEGQLSRLSIATNQMTELCAYTLDRIAATYCIRALF